MTDGMSLIWNPSSYCGKVFISLTSSPNVVPDPEFLAECVRESFEEMKGAAAAVGGPAPELAKPAAAKERPAKRGAAKKAPVKQISMKSAGARRAPAGTTAAARKTAWVKTGVKLTADE